MEADFEGTMQDLPKEDKKDMEEEEEEEGDADRIDQQMGDVGEDEQVWGWVGKGRVAVGEGPGIGALQQRAWGYVRVLAWVKRLGAADLGKGGCCCVPWCWSSGCGVVDVVLWMRCGR